MPRTTSAFFTALGFDFNPQFTDDNAACHLDGHHWEVMWMDPGAIT